MGGEPQSAGASVLLLGPLLVERDGRQIPVVGGQQAVLLALVASRIGHVVSTDQLIDAAWDGQPPSTAPAALRVHLAKLRALLSGDACSNPLRNVGHGYVLDDKYVDTDVLAVRRLVTRARAVPDGEAAVARALGDALQLWRGEPFSGVRDVAWLRQEARHLRELRLDLQDELSALQLELGRHLELCTALSVLVKEEPLRELRTRQLMLALYRSGRQADALAAYGELRDALAEDLGVDPSPETRQLELDILRQEPGLERVVAKPDDRALVDPGPRGALDQPRSAPMVHDVVRQRLSSLDRTDAQTVRVVAVLRELAVLDIVAAAVRRLPGDVIATVGRAHAAGLLATHEDGRPLSFTRGALRDEVLVDLPDADRAQLHDRCAEALEAVLPGLPGSLAAAWHRVAQARLRPADAEEIGYGVVRALDACRSAGRHDVVDLLATSALVEVEWPASIEVDVITRLIFARQVLNRMAEATELWERGLDLARKAGNVERFALLVLAHDWTQRSMLAPDDVRPLLAEVLTLLGPQASALRVAVASAYLLEVATPGRAEELGDLLLQVQKQAEELADAASMRVADYARHVLLRGSPDLEKRQQVARRLWAAVDVPTPPAIWRAEALLASVYDAFVAGDLDRAESMLDDLGSSAEASGSVRMRWQHAITRAALCRERGDFARSDELAEEAMLLGAEGAIPDAFGADALHRLQVLFHTETLELFRPTIDAFVEAQPDNPLVLGARALALAQVGADDARAAIEAAAGRLRRLGPYDEASLLSAALVVEAAAHVGELDEATRTWLQELFEPFAGQFVTFGQVSATWGPVDRLRGMLVVLSGECESASELISTALMSTRSVLWREQIAVELTRLSDT